MIRYSFFSSICLSLRWVNVQLEGEKGSKQEWKKRSAEFTDRWLELGEVWPQMGWKCGGHEEFRIQCGVELCCPTVPGSLEFSRLDGHLLRLLLRSYLGVLGRKPTTPAYLAGGVVVHTHRQTYTCLHSFVSCLYMLFNFLFSYRECEDLLWFYRSQKSLYFFLNKKKGLKVLALNDSTRMVNILSSKHWKSSVILHAVKCVSEVILLIKHVFHFQPLKTQSFWLQFWCWYFPAEPILGLREI